MKILEEQFNKKHFSYCGKYSEDKLSGITSYHLLPYHCLDVAATVEALLESNVFFTKDLSELLQLPSNELIKLLCFFVAIHDLGKFATAFQLLFSAKDLPLYAANQRVKPYDGKEYRHDRLGYYFWLKNAEKITQVIASQQDLDEDDLEEAMEALEVILHSVLGHHGKPISSSNPSGLKSFIEPPNEQAAAEFIEDLLRLFAPKISLKLLLDESWQARVSQVSWHLAGLTVLADWLGSNTEYFPYESKPLALEEYWSIAQEGARKALQNTDVWRPVEVQPFKSVKEHYGFEPTPLQRWAETVAIDDKPQLFILEDVTGAGKTEAALTLTHRLMQTGAASGFYFGMPTMATSNAMFSRVADHYLQMLSTEDGGKPSIVLAHGAREMNDLFQSSVLPEGQLDKSYSLTDFTATAQCNAWLADSRKKALLAPVGVGTLDQALLAVLPRRHQSLRLLGLHRKILIFDEVHSADEYMFELLESLLALHLHQGGSVILLTATLSKKQRQRVINIWANALQLGVLPVQNTDFPLATKVAMTGGLEEFSVASRKEVSREVKVDFLHTEDACVQQVLTAANKGRCVVWVRNTVDDALSAHQKISEQLSDPDDCLLFHSRFAMKDRKRIESQVLDIFGKGSNNKQRAGKILIATQVFQESLDADADLMISDICPIDDLIQRAGRLHRHTRNAQGAYESGVIDPRPQPTLIVHAPEWQDNPQQTWLSENFQNTEYVYRSPGRLWLGMQVLRKLGALRMPSEARELIEAVYSEDALERMPEALKQKDMERLGEERSKAAKAQTSVINWQHHGYNHRSANGWYEDDTDISTRYSDIETAEVVLLQENQQGQLEFYAQVESFALRLSTVKLGVKKYVNHLKLVADNDPRLAHLKKQHPRIQFKFLKLWEYRGSGEFGYSSKLGVYPKKSPLTRGTRDE